MQEEEFFARKETFENLKRLVEFNCANLSRKDDIGLELAFDEIIPVAQDAIELLKVFDQQDVLELPPSNFNPLKSYVDQLTVAVNRVGRFTTTMDNARQERLDIMSYFGALRDGMYRDLLPIVSWLSLRKSDLGTFDQRSKILINELQENFRDAQKRILDTEGEIIEIRENAKQAAGLTALVEQARVFGEEAKLHNRAAQDWAMAAIFFAVVLCAYAVVSYSFFPLPDKKIHAAQLIFSKTLIGGVLVFALILSARNFMSNRHNSIVNRHRHNSLTVSQALIDAAKVQENREVLLTQAAASIFAPQDTGFTKATAENSSIKLIDFNPKMGGGGS